MDRPTDLTGRTGGDPDEGSDDVARAFRAALGEGHGSSSASETRTTASGASEQSRRQAPASLLAAVERRAARLHRRRQAAALVGAAAAAAVVVFLGSLVLPQLDLSLSGGASGGSAAGSSADSGSGGGPAPAAAPSERSGELQGGGAAGGPTATSQSESLADANVPTLSEASMLTAADLTGAFSVPVRESAPAPESDPRLTLGACVDGDAGSVDALQLWRVDLTAAPSASAAEPPGVVERVAVVGGPAAAASALEQVRQAVPGCSGPGLEGTGPTAALDASAVTPDGGEALVLASTSGQGSPTLRVYVAIGSELVQLDATSDASSAQAAYSALVPAVRAAVTRATGGSASFSAPLPSSGAP
ncbi:hypothetical protein [Quadrisphaera setariae]|uniref:PknH-like extracellular domain-containing protein n=1 Tax=Quadrisphaera setariae TaxID=2593304 RepID=A0A5C8ZGU9_9ACTN|nr:hypothetical protein [Quadrisphaera setariae]TXR56070.1 hypothetical protein FMM08_11535 [Quadrisphaera setariae]